jgi:hypothetical protein
MPIRNPEAVRTAIAGALGRDGSTVSLDELVKADLLPPDFAWSPDLCLSFGDVAVLVHALRDRVIPDYLIAAADQAKAKSARTKILIVADELLVDTQNGRTYLPSQYVAAAVADACIRSEFGLAFESPRTCHVVFLWDFKPPKNCALPEEETGHIPRWLLDALASSDRLSAYAKRYIVAFVDKYRVATRRKGIDYDLEANLLIDLAKKLAHGNRKLYFPFGQLELLKEWEHRRASPTSRDHFFHTFNNFFLGLHILSQLARDGESLAEVDNFVSKQGRSGKLAGWEVLWMLTCLFHDPGYVAENYWGTFRFSHGFTGLEAIEENEIPEVAKQHIRNAWDTEYSVARNDLLELHSATISKWIPTSVRKKKTTFDIAISQVYFDGQKLGHSLMSGLKLIKYCHQSDVPSSWDEALSVTAAVVAALSMMFHDPHARETLLKYRIGPIPFEKLPYAALLMFVDSIQDDRRTIKKSRFQVHGVLVRLSVVEAKKEVTAEICLPELPPSAWPGRIAEYESVMEWINLKSEWKFVIDYKSRLNAASPSGSEAAVPQARSAPE